MFRDKGEYEEKKDGSMCTGGKELRRRESVKIKEKERRKGRERKRKRGERERW